MRTKKQKDPIGLRLHEACVTCGQPVAVPSWGATCSKRCESIKNDLARAEFLKGKAIRRAGGLTELDVILGVKAKPRWGV